LPAGHGWNEHPFGVLTNIPLVWLALAVPRLWSRGRSVETRSILGGFLAAMVMLFGIGALTLGLFFWTAGRYEMEFLPALVLLGVIGILSLERALSHRLVCRRAARWGWSLLLGFSVAFNLLASLGQIAEAHSNLGDALMSQGRRGEAIGQYEQAVHLNPNYGPAHNNLGIALEQAGRVQEAIQHFEQTLRIKPDYAEALNNLGIAMMAQGRVQEAIGHYEQALRIQPDYASAQCNWANALFREGKATEAIGHYEQVLRIRPDFAEVHFSLGLALEQTGRAQEAAQQYEEALRIKPDFTPAQNALVRLQPRQ